MALIGNPVSIGTSAPGVENTSSISLTTTADVAPGEHIFVPWDIGGERELGSVTDNSGLGLSWQLVPGGKGAGCSVGMAMAYCEKGLPKGTVITASSPPSQNAARGLSAFSVSGLSSKRWLDQVAIYTHAAAAEWDTGQTAETTSTVQLAIALVAEGDVSATTSTVSTGGYTELTDFSSAGRCQAVYYKQLAAKGKQRAQGTFSTSTGEVAGMIVTLSQTPIERGPGPTGLPEFLPASTGATKVYDTAKSLEANIALVKPGETLLVPDPVFPAVAYAAPLVEVKGEAGKTITVKTKSGKSIPTTGRWKLDNAKYLKIDGFSDNGFTSANVGSFTRGSCQDVEWWNCIVHEAQSEGFTATLEGGVPTRIRWINCLSFSNGQRNEPTKNLDHGFYVAGHELLVLNCISHNNPARGIQFHPEATDSIISHFTALNNGRSGIQISGDEDEEHNSHNCRVVNSISIDNEYGIRTFWATEEGGIAGTSNYAWRNICFGNSAADYLVTAPGSLTVEEKVEGNPLLNETTFRPGGGSPALAMADPEWSPTFDFSGNLRGAAPSIGALELEPATAVPLPPPPGLLAVQVVSEGGTGRGFDITAEAENLNFSNVDPGGDETCTFTLHRYWFAANPEVGKGDIVRVLAGIDVLWNGRIEEDDRSTGDSETIGVTAYGLGNRLGDETFREIYVDRDMGRWGAIPNPHVEALGTTWRTDAGNSEIHTAESGLPALALTFTRMVNTAGSTDLNEVWYDAGGIPLGYMYLESTVYGGAMGGSWVNQAFFSPTDSGVGGSLTPITSTGAATIVAPAGSVYASLGYYFNTVITIDGEWRWEFRKLAMYGRHGLAGKGEQPYGFSADQIAADMAGRANGIQVRNVSTFPYVIPQFTVTTPTTPKVGLEEVSQYANVDYGVWGPNSPFDRSTDGYFDYTEKDEATQHWFANRADFEPDLQFHSETSTLYDTVDVSYTNEDEKQRVERFSIVSPDLDAAGLSPRVYPLDAGTTTPAGAALFAEIFLRIFAGFAPARGEGTVVGSIHHYRRGKIPVYYLRADGSNIRIPDILPAETAFALDATPDRRTIFPIKRVTVDCSGDVPQATVEFDQNSDALATLLAQQATEATLVNA